MKKLNLILVPSILLLGQSVALAEETTANVNFTGEVEGTCSFDNVSDGTLTISGNSLSTDDKGSVEVTSNGGATLSVTTPTYVTKPTDFDTYNTSTGASATIGENGGDSTSSGGSDLDLAPGTKTIEVSVEDNTYSNDFIAGEYKLQVTITCEFNTDSTGGTGGTGGT